MAISNPGINLILGPVILGIIINAFLFGIVFAQGVTYYTSWSYKKDSWLIRGLVSWSLLLDLFHSCAVILVVWEYCINHFGDVAFLATTPWPFPTTPIFSSSASVPIQIFLAWRVKLLSKSWAIFGLLSTLSITSGILAFISAIKALEDFADLIPVVDAWLALSVVCDLSLTTLLFFYLHRSRTGFSIITRLTIQSIETASFSACLVLDLITFTVIQNTNFHFVFALLSGRMYTNTLLTTLNSRSKMIEDMSGVNTIPSALRGTEVHISVEQNQAVAMPMENFPLGKKSARGGLNGSTLESFADDDRKVQF
ncbi:hypothetical protein GGX14DRAFT_411192 [Mycena pura]|uniref:DUF6534 domain-containing protein n=1 Tax=Mycena pura TaxID=153505 RepID=A0AAD7E5V7_9AGAR|nr:hypothetical protein GGX14DRAFT_411192 [Mycena pura]